MPGTACLGLRGAMGIPEILTVAKHHILATRILPMQVDVHLLQKELTSNKDAVSTNLTSFHQYDDKVRYVNIARSHGCLKVGTA